MDRGVSGAAERELAPDESEQTPRLKERLTLVEGRLADALRLLECLEAHFEHERRLQSELSQDLLRRLGNLALKDGLTGLYNRRYFEDALKHRLRLCRRLGLPLSLLYIDVDHFKRYNDRAGHVAGDALLRRLGRLLDVEGDDGPPARRSDVIARVGGEEFVMILFGTDRAGARVCAERLRQRIAERLPAASQAFSVGAVTVTIGIATFPEDGEDAITLLHRADAALLEGKRAGRNQVRTYQPDHR